MSDDDPIMIQATHTDGALAYDLSPKGCPGCGVHVSSRRAHKSGCPSKNLRQ